VLYVEPHGEADIDGAYGEMKKVFGVASLSRCARCEKSVESIFETAKSYLSHELSAARSFKVESKRADKRFPLTSIQLSQEVGGLLADEFPSCAVDVHTPELTVFVELREEYAFVHGNPDRGARGLPPGSSGRAVALLSGGIDSPVAIYMAARRGLKIIPVHFFSYPYTSMAAREKVLSLTKILTAYCGSMTVEIVPFTRIQEEIAKNCPEEFGTIITRRFMMTIAEKIAEANGALALVTGENLGQVASQTLESLGVTEAGLGIPVIRPLVCFDKQEIIDLSVKIGTYDTSTLPYEDCCTVFTPRRPSTKPRLPRILDAERSLDREGLIAEALAGAEKLKLNPED
jgi:thiamine biosynthesis protein ThiI